MKIQEIRRNGSKYYHIYLPKNIVENVLHWKGKDTLLYSVVSDTLVLRRNLEPTNEWQNYISCKICFNPAIIIKLIKNPIRKQYILIARCPLDHTVLKATLPINRLSEWKPMILPQIFTCDICNGTLMEEKRKFARTGNGFRVHMRLFCRNCGRHRIKVLAQEIWDELNLPSCTPLSPQTFSKAKSPSFAHCPTCEEPISPAQPFCGQCGTCLIK
jgi:hypothetical protein